MQYRHLYYFVKIVEAGSFSQAARTIHVAQPALSQQIAELEASLGISLLQKSARGVRPTAAGQRFYEEASSILRRYEDLSGLVRSGMGEVAGLVSLGMPASLSTTLVGPFIEQCRTAMSNRMMIRTRNDSLASHILPVSGTMIGVCATLIGLVKLAESKHGSSHVDEYAALAAVAFLASAPTSSSEHVVRR